MEVMKADVSEAFLDKFSKLFREFMLPDSNLIYTTSKDDEALFGKE